MDLVMMFSRLQAEFKALLSLAKQMFCLSKLSVGMYKSYLKAASMMLGCPSINCQLVRSCVDQNNCFTKLYCFFKKTYIDLDRHLAFV